MMKRMLVLSAAVVLVLCGSFSAWALDKGPLLDRVKKITNTEIVKWAKNPAVVNAVKEANMSAVKSRDEINRLDEKWKATEGVDEWIGGFINNSCAGYLKSLQAKSQGKLILYPEIFVMDKQGCIVAEAEKTSDYWQGDEDKFVKSFAGGKGEIFIGEPEFDKSSGKYTVQVSVPVPDPDTSTAIGAMTAGIDLDAIGEQAL